MHTHTHIHILLRTILLLQLIAYLPAHHLLPADDRCQGVQASVLGWTEKRPEDG